MVEEVIEGGDDKGMKDRGRRNLLIFVAIGTILAAAYGICAGWRGREKKLGQETVETVNKKTTGDERKIGNHGRLQVYMGQLSDRISPFQWTTQGDERVLSLLYQRVSELGSISVIKKKKGAVYRVQLTKDVMDSEGRLITSDTLVYNYYQRCRAGYTGNDRIGEMKIKGVLQYRYGASGKKLDKRKKKIRKVLDDPDKKMRGYITENMVIPILRREYAWVESLYYNRSAQKICKKFPKTQELFAYYYAPDTSYTGKGKKKEQVIREIAGQYGTDLGHLGEMTGRDYEPELRSMAAAFLWPECKAGNGRIEGIRKLDDRTVEIETVQYRESDVQKIGQIFIAAGQKKGKMPVGSGMYIMQNDTGTQKVLQGNSYYDRRAENPMQIILEAQELTAVQCIQKIKDGSLDMACVWERTDYEKDRIVKALQKGDALWETAVMGGVIYHPGRVNATTLSMDSIRKQDIPEIFTGLEMNPS